MVYRFCPCGKGQIIGNLRSIHEGTKPEINCSICHEKYDFKSYLKRDSWEGNYWYEWVLVTK